MKNYDIYKILKKEIIKKENEEYFYHENTAFLR